MVESFLNGAVHLWQGDSREVLRGFQDNAFDAGVTDPPYALVSIVNRFGSADAAPTRDGDVYARSSAGFLGQQWDTGETAFAREFWGEVFRVLKPGAHLIAFSGTRTYHRLACAIEDAGFEVRDMLQWLYGSGFPKSHEIKKHLERIFGEGSPEAEAWAGWETALKPACEPIVLARKPLEASTIARNIVQHGTGALNVEACRIEAEKATGWGGKAAGDGVFNNGTFNLRNDGDARPVEGRWPANVLHDGSAEVLDLLGEAARFFYSAKANDLDRAGSEHPTVKRVDLMEYLCRLITPPGGAILDPFAGSGTTGEAAWRQGFQCTLIEREAAYCTDIRERLAIAAAGEKSKRRAIAKRKGGDELGGLFA